MRTLIIYCIFFLFTSNNSYCLNYNQEKNTYSKFPFFSPYSDVTLSSDYLLISKETGVKGFILAFIQDAGKCTPAWDGNLNKLVSNQWGKEISSQLSKFNLKYKISFGGQTGNDLGFACKSIDDLSKAYETVFATYEPQGIDIDIEGRTIKNFKIINKILGALKKFQNNHKEIAISITLPVTIEGLDQYGKHVIDIAKKKSLVYKINLMTMNYDSTLKCNMLECIIKTTDNFYKFLKEKYKKDILNMIEITIMIGVNDTLGKTFTLADARALNLFSRKKGLGGIHIWSVARDSPCKLKKANSMCSGILKQKKWEFMSIFSN